MRTKTDVLGIGGLVLNAAFSGHLEFEICAENGCPWEKKERETSVC